MGAGGSKLSLPDITIVKHDLSLDEGFASSPSIARVDWEGQHNLVVAYVSSPEREHGHPRQHIRVGISIDGTTDLFERWCWVNDETLFFTNIYYYVIHGCIVLIEHVDARGCDRPLILGRRRG